MIKAVTVLRPFIKEQVIYVYENGNKIQAEKVEVDKVPNKILEYCDKYAIEEINLGGPKQYTRGIGRKLQESILTKYNKEIEIKYL